MAALRAALLSVLDRTVTAMGSRMLADHLANPLTDVAAIDERLARTWKNLAQLRLRLGDLPGARSAAERALALDEALSEGHAVRSIALRRAGDLGGAVQAAQLAIELDPAEPQLLLVLASALIGLARYDEAREALARARVLKPSLAGLEQLSERIARESGR